MFQIGIIISWSWLWESFWWLSFSSPFCLKLKVYTWIDHRHYLVMIDASTTTIWTSLVHIALWVPKSFLLSFRDGSLISATHKCFQRGNMVWLLKWIFYHHNFKEYLLLHLLWMNLKQLFLGVSGEFFIILMQKLPSLYNVIIIGTNHVLLLLFSFLCPLKRKRGENGKIPNLSLVLLPNFLYIISNSPPWILYLFEIIFSDQRLFLFGSKRHP